MRLSLNNSFDDTYDFRLYDFTLIERTSNGNLVSSEGPFLVSLFPEAMSIGMSSLFIEQVIKNYSNKVNLTYNEDAYDTLIDDIVDSHGDNFSNIQTIDFIFCKDKEQEDYSILELDTESIGIDHYEGIFFNGGNDGTFTYKAPGRATAIAEAYANAFSGLVDKSVMNKKAFPFNIVLDANYPTSVKNAIADFCRARKDVFGVIDTGIIPTTSGSLAWRKNEFQEASYY